MSLANSIKTNKTTMEVWTENKEHSVEGHIFTGTLKFKGETIWGPTHCHDNTARLAEALQNADYRFSLLLSARDKSVEGHIRYISVKDWNGNTVLDRLSTHDSMDSLARAVMKKINENGSP